MKNYVSLNVESCLMDVKTETNLSTTNQKMLVFVARFAAITIHFVASDVGTYAGKSRSYFAPALCVHTTQRPEN